MDRLTDAAIDFCERKRRISEMERPGNDLPTLNDLSKMIKEHLAKGSDLTVPRTDKTTGEIVEALELRDMNIRLFLRPTRATWKTCANCGAEIQTRYASTSLIMEPIEDAWEEDARQRKAMYARNAPEAME